MPTDEQRQWVKTLTGSGTIQSANAGESATDSDPRAQLRNKLSAARNAVNKPGLDDEQAGPAEKTEPKVDVKAPLSIGASVGQGGKNKPDDVQAVQVALNRRTAAGLVLDAKCGPRTIAAIKAFQSKLGMPHPDGLVEPGNKTERALNGEQVSVAEKQKPEKANGDVQPATPAGTATSAGTKPNAVPTTKAGADEFQKFEITRYYVKSVKTGDTPVKDISGKVFASISLDSLKKADIEGTLRLPDGRVLNIHKSGWTYREKEVMVEGKPVMKKKPHEFDPEKSRWIDVSKSHPWGAGTGGRALIPFRSLAGKKKYSGKKVLIKELKGRTMPDGKVHDGICTVVDTGAMGETHFDWFVGAEENFSDKRTDLPTYCNVKIFD